MKIYLYLSNKIVSFSLPSEISGSFSFDEANTETKLINIEARDGKWVLYSTPDSKIINNNSIVENIEITENNYYVLSRDNKNYLIYICNLLEDDINIYEYNQNINLLIGNDNSANIIFNCPYLANTKVKIYFENNKLILETNNKNIIYINNKKINNNKEIIKIGNYINLLGLKILILNKILLLNNPNNKVIINLEQSKLNRFNLPNQEPTKNIEVKDKDLYSKEDFYSKSPRIRRIIETKEIELSQPPQTSENEEMPLILTLGPMMTMGIASIVTITSTVSRIGAKETTLKNSLPSLITSGTMLLSMLLWPTITRMYNKKMKKKKKKEIIEKYNKYLNDKKQELSIETKLQKEILIENLITTDECLNIIKTKGIGFWDKRIDQDDFLKVRIGTGNELLKVDIKYPEKGFTIDEDELKKQVDKMAEEYKYIENVPIGYSFLENKITAIMGNIDKSHTFMNNLILQLLAFYTYEDLKLVVFTNEDNEHYWDYIKYLNHNFDNNRNYRFFATTQDSCKNVSDYLNIEVNRRMNIKEDYPKPHYIILIDDYNRVKRFDFIKNITETDENLGFSIILLEERLSKLPSKCNNFISLGINNQGGVLKNSYEKQEQTIFNDEINYNIDMMNITKILSNIPIEFEEGLKQIPDTISFMEMEKVGKVEQLNILNRWNINDSTTSLKAEIGVDEQGDLMYLDLHEKYHGPHGLIAGTTGSGKSEFIITYILSMCINYSPDDVSFILIDYKGGGLALAFENRSTGVVLPHLAGTITNLDKAEMDRTLVSIDSEVKRRQKLFNEARDKLGESTIDIYKYQRFYHEGRLDEPLPHLFIICDEFAELKSQQPEFMDNLISVARIGRSLGVHLILATQKPSGVVNDQIWSNSKFKVCLKVQDEQDSKEMLKKPDAAYLKQVGRFYLQVGYDEYYALGQSGWCGAKYYPSEKIVKQIDKSINFIDDCGNYIKSIQAGNSIKIEPQGEQIGNILKSIIDVAETIGKKSKRLWLDNIPNIILLDDLEKKYNLTPSSYNVEAIIGEYDAPEKQEQGKVIYNLLEDGNTIIYGNDSIEKEMLLNTIIYSTTKNHSPEEINYYIIDYGSESLRRYQSLPHIGGIVFQEEDEKYNNLFKLIRNEIQKRKKLFSDYGGEYKSYIKTKKIPIKVIILNNYDSIYESNQNLYEELPELVRDSERYGIVFIFTANATNSVQNKISSNCHNIYAFKLKDQLDYNMLFNTRTKMNPKDNIGRGLLNIDGVHEFQTASIIKDDEEMNNYIINYINKQKEIYKISAPKVPTLPNIVRINDIKEKLQGIRSIPVGISKKELEICTVDYISNLGNIITSNKIDNTKIFTLSLIVLFKYLKTNLYIFDPAKLLPITKEYHNNYYNDNIEDNLDKLKEKINTLLEQKKEEEAIIIIYGLDKFINNIQDTKKIEEFNKLLKQYEHISIIGIDDANKIKSFAYETWFKELYNTNDGIWIGKGIVDQSAIKLNNINREMSKDIKNNMGYLITENSGELIKLIDFITKDEGDNNE